MIDSATGVKVRLRLGVHSDQDGEKLAIFYKLFTSRPVIDLCASSPRQDSFTKRNINKEEDLESVKFIYHD